MCVTCISKVACFFATILKISIGIQTCKIIFRSTCDLISFTRYILVFLKCRISLTKTCLHTLI